VNKKIALISIILIVIIATTVYSVSTLNLTGAAETKNTLTVKTVNGQVNYNGEVLLGDIKYSSGTNITLTAIADSDFTFKGWIINGKECSVTGYYFPMYENGGYSNPDYIYVKGNTVVIPLYESFIVEPIFI
jgi:hypothetical protein